MGHQICNMLQESLLRVFMIQSEYLYQVWLWAPSLTEVTSRVSGIQSGDIVLSHLPKLDRVMLWFENDALCQLNGRITGLKRVVFCEDVAHILPTRFSALCHYTKYPGWEKNNQSWILAYIVVSFHSQIIPIIMWANAC